MSKHHKEIFEHEKKQNTGIKEEELTVNDKIILEQLEEENKITVSYGEAPNYFLKLITNSFIGSMNLEGPDTRINILPKIFRDDKQKWKNLNLFLDYCTSDTFDYVKNAKNFYEGTDEPTLLNHLHIELIREYENIQKQGLLKSYVIHAENTSSMRGKLLMQHQMVNDAVLRPQFFCEFDELEYDSIENRVILQALTVVERTSDNPHVKMKSMDLAQKLSGLVKKVTTHRSERQRMMQSYSRHNLRYRHIHQICEKVIDESGIKDIYSGDYSYVAPVFYDMNELFENFVQKLFQKFYPGAEVQYGEVSWTGDGDLGSRQMRPDITIWKGGVCEKIIDVKYKTKIITAGDLYQIGFYMHEFGKKNPDEKPIDEAFAITPEFEGAKSGTYTSSKSEKKVFVKRINVKRCLELIKTQNDKDLKAEVADWIKPLD